MKIIKNIHNNISLCIDSKGNEVVAFGKGIGFKKPPYDLPISSIERTFYNVNPVYIDTLANIPENIIEISKQVIDFANEKFEGRFDSNLVFTLADHINFSIERKKKNMYISLPMMHEVKYMYPDEIVIGEYALKLIEKKMDIVLPNDEAAVITLHVIEYGLNSMNVETTSSSRQKIDKCVEVIEEEMDLKINKDSFNYSRFLSHMYFLLDRLKNNEPLKSENMKMFAKLVNEYPKIYECSKKIGRVLETELSDEELMYLMLHINRLISREK